MKYIVRMKTERGETESKWDDLGEARKQAARLLKVWRKSGYDLVRGFVPLRWLGRDIEVEVLREHADGRRESFREEQEGGEPDYDLAVKYPSGWEKEANF